MIYEHPYANLHLEKEREKNVNTIDNIMWKKVIKKKIMLIRCMQRVSIYYYSKKYNL